MKKPCVQSNCICMAFFYRDKSILADGKGPNSRGLSRKHITEQVHVRLKRMNLAFEWKRYNQPLLIVLQSEGQKRGKGR